MLQGAVTVRLRFVPAAFIPSSAQNGAYAHIWETAEDLVAGAESTGRYVASERGVLSSGALTLWGDSGKERTPEERTGEKRTRRAQAAADAPTPTGTGVLARA